MEELMVKSKILAGLALKNTLIAELLSSPKGIKKVQVLKVLKTNKFNQTKVCNVSLVPSLDWDGKVTKLPSMFGLASKKVTLTLFYSRSPCEFNGTRDLYSAQVFLSGYHLVLCGDNTPIISHNPITSDGGRL